jgi:hypothetical protein
MLASLSSLTAFGIPAEVAINPVIPNKFLESRSAAEAKNPEKAQRGRLGRLSTIAFLPDG